MQVMYLLLLLNEMQGIDPTLMREGWYVFRQSGSHMIMRHPKKEGQIVVPDHGASEVGAGLQNKILKDAGLK